ncbi:3-phosphoglycerate dehydrogenase [Sulfolobus sp. A20]|uniref:glycolate dehydrogenase n=1 Tax=Sulfolobaceae TaxID=118883 RepID=UPI000845E9E1|nr:MULTISPECIES: glycolate dehydrogenase [unclassified Sulfolobus]TRM76851.1 3-phosphoglycerate dehydrogenase [Sulfolobus sp. E5]TRM77259.1 3-phosphoglycerate dehydrogenase [Sulfolobus sp. A20-N-F8]TRM84890.1 3-phosphoglycerate dehydrogenase [Sulfolobus sp. F3]TRN04751.1 3-phosphoglycerate dehydrogenase [Sulfolobus sp. E1]AOL16349.1 3-phosphoglycerate dehydrogenase [Sulfolobus sp. A20]
MRIISTEKVPEECKKVINVKDENLTDNDFREAEILLTWPSRVNKDLISKMPNIKVIQTFSAGVDDLDFSILPQNVKVFSNAGAYALSVAEHTWGLILALAKGVGTKKRTIVYEVTGKTLLILGGGGIGSEVARIGKSAFRNYVVGISRSFKKPEWFDEKHTISMLRQKINEADIIVDTLPLNKQTKSLLNYELLKNVKPKTIIVNVGRGETVDEEGIYKLLRERPDVRFGTDVFWRKNGKEDFFNTKLWELDNFTGTLHTAGAYGNDEVMKRAMTIACMNVKKYIDSGVGDNEVRREDYV